MTDDDPFKLTEFDALDEDRRRTRALLVSRLADAQMPPGRPARADHELESARQQRLMLDHLKTLDPVRDADAAAQRRWSVVKDWLRGWRP